MLRLRERLEDGLGFERQGRGRPRRAQLALQLARLRAQLANHELQLAATRLGGASERQRLIALPRRFELEQASQISLLVRLSRELERGRAPLSVGLVRRPIGVGRHHQALEHGPQGFLIFALPALLGRADLALRVRARGLVVRLLGPGAFAAARRPFRFLVFVRLERLFEEAQKAQRGHGAPHLGDELRRARPKPPGREQLVEQRADLCGRRVVELEQGTELREHRFARLVRGLERLLELLLLAADAAQQALALLQQRAVALALRVQAQAGLDRRGNMGSCRATASGHRDRYGAGSVESKDLSCADGQRTTRR